MRHLRRGVLVRLRGVARLRAMVPRAEAVPFYDHAAVPIDVKVEAERVPEREAVRLGRRSASVAARVVVGILEVHLHLCANQNFPARLIVASLGTVVGFHTGCYRGAEEEREDLEAADPRPC